MKVDTGWSRGHLSYQMGLDGLSVQAGILSPFNSKDGAGVALYPAMMNAGIKRHFVSFWNRDGSLRETFTNWCERHGLKIWREKRAEVRLLERGPHALTRASYGRSLTDKGAGLAARGMWVWGYAHPWIDTARYFLLQQFPNLLREECEGKL